MDSTAAHTGHAAPAPHARPVPPPKPAAPAKPAPLTRPDGSPVRVLVVDDEPDLAEVLAGVLRYEGWQVRTAGDVATALAGAAEFLPDAVVLDIMLPDGNGLAALRDLRAARQ